MGGYATDVKFVCPNCNAPVELILRISEPSWGADRAIDRIVQEEVELVCPHCGTEHAGDLVNRDNDVSITLLDHPAVEVDAGYGHDRTGDAPYGWDDVPETPAQIFADGLADALVVLEKLATDDWTSTVNRMVFVNCFAALEAYLSDTLLNLLSANRAALERILEQEAELKDDRISLFEALTDADVVAKRVRAHFQKQIFHNLAKVSVFFRIAGRFDIFPNDDVKRRLFSALPVRHDCVHRNGRTKDGVHRLEVTATFVSQIAGDMLALVDHVESCIQAAG